MELIPVQKIKDIDASSTILIDVRNKSEHDAGAIPDSICIPADSIAPFCEALSKYERVVLYCNSGTRAKMAASALAGSGLKNVSIADGGFPAWRQAGFEVLQKTRSTISLQRQVFMIVGSLILLSFVLDTAVPGARYLSMLFGAGLLFAGVTDKCLLGMMLSKMPWNKHVQCNNGGKTCEA